MKLIDGKKIRNEILGKVREEVAKLTFVPVFCDVLVGNDPASKQYVEMKASSAESVGMKFHRANFPASITTEELVREIDRLNKIPNMCGIIVQLPLPETLDRRAVLDAIDPVLDVDFLGSAAGSVFYSGGVNRGFPTAMASLAILDTLHLDLKDKKIICLGQGELVGKPVAALLKFRGLNPICITRKTPARDAYGNAVAGGENKEKILKEADVIISGIGRGKYVTADMVKEGVVLIDAGTSEDSKRPAEGRASIVGDIDLESVKDVASFVSPVPGGVGPVTVAMLLENVLYVAKKLTK